MQAELLPLKEVAPCQRQSRTRLVGAQQALDGIQALRGLTPRPPPPPVTQPTKRAAIPGRVAAGVVIVGLLLLSAVGAVIFSSQRTPQPTSTPIAVPATTPIAVPTTTPAMTPTTTPLATPIAAPIATPTAVPVTKPPPKNKPRLLLD